MTGGFIWYEIMATDADAAAAFYGPVLGWTFSGSGDPDVTTVEYRHISRADGGSAGGLLQLTPDMTSHGARPAWIGYIHVDNVDAAVSAIVEDGGRLVMPKMALPVGEMAMVTDPQGAPFYVMTPVPPPGQPDARSDVFDPEKPGHVRWNELNASELDEAVAFYTTRFGWRQEGEMDMGPMSPYRFLQHDGVTIGAAMRKVPQQPMPAWLFYVGVADIDRALDAIRAHGGRVIQGPDQIPGGEYSITAVDPQGAAFGVVGPRLG